MAPYPAGSPTPTSASTFKSPLRGLRVDACEWAGGEEIYADAQARVTQWRKDFVSSASFEAQQGLRELCHEREHLKDLEADLAGIQGLVDSASQLQTGGVRLAEVLRSSADAAGSRAQAMVHVCDELRGLSDMNRQKLQQEERKVARQQEVADAQHSEALKLLGTYKDRLGLAITRVAPQTVRMAFSLLDERDPEREFFFTLGLAELEEEDSHNTAPGKISEAYGVNECTPHVAELPHLLKELNADASSVTALPRFVCSMRRAFLKGAVAAAAPEP